MLDAILFDMGGTLDGDGEHWLNRFATTYEQAGVAVSWDALRAAFDAAEARAASDAAMMTASLVDMVDRHVAWQFEHLGRAEDARRATVVKLFIEPVRAAGRRNTEMLAELKSRGFQLGVVSNACGNVDVLCGDLGYAPYLSVIVDSRRVGLSKPDPAIYQFAALKLRLDPPAIMMVGDSFERDVRPSKSIGMQTAWLRGNSAACPDPGLVDITLDTLAELPRVLGVRERTVA
jgi:HAD superfamily hydrolase (TIGR01509 family)